MRRRFFRILPWFLGLALLVLIYRLVSLEAVIRMLRDLRLWQIGVLILANTAIIVAITTRWWLLLGGSGCRIPFLPLVGYRLAAFGLSYFTPGPHVGGEPLQVFLVENRHGVPRSTAIASVALDKIIELSVNFTFLLLGIAAALQWRIVPLNSGRQALGLAAALLVVPLFYLGATVRGIYPATRVLQPLAGRWPKLQGALVTVTGSEAHVGRFFHSSPWAFLTAVAVTLAGWGVMIVEYWLMIRFLGVDLTLPQLVTAMTAARIAILLFIPAGLGALEASQIAAFGMVGVDPAVGISASLLIRARDTTLAAIGLWLGGRWMAADRQNSATHQPGTRPHKSI